jgi:hypothetical protein
VTSALKKNAAGSIETWATTCRTASAEKTTIETPISFRFHIGLKAFFIRQVHNAKKTENISYVISPTGPSFLVNGTYVVRSYRERKGR